MRRWPRQTQSLDELVIPYRCCGHTSSCERKIQTNKQTNTGTAQTQHVPDMPSAASAQPPLWQVSKSNTIFEKMLLRHKLPSSMRALRPLSKRPALSLPGLSNLVDRKKPLRHADLPIKRLASCEGLVVTQKGDTGLRSGQVRFGSKSKHKPTGRNKKPCRSQATRESQAGSTPQAPGTHACVSQPLEKLPQSWTSGSCSQPETGERQTRSTRLPRHKCPPQLAGAVASRKQ